MNPTPGLKKYYIGLALLMFFALGCVAYALTQASAAKADKKTNDALQGVGEALDRYTVRDGTVAPSLQAAGAKDVPSSITYTKLDTNKYKVCINYKTVSSGFDAGWFSLLGGFFGSGYNNQTYSYSGNTVFDTTVQYHHKKGQNCQTVAPYIYNDSSPSSSTDYPSTTYTPSLECNPKNLKVSGSATVLSVDQSAKLITFDPLTSGIYDAEGNKYSHTSAHYNSSTVFCDQYSRKTDVSAITVGQTITVYLTSNDATVLSQVYAY
jgi:hypothetical protein